MSPLSAYVHVPFCLSRCAYCDFTSYAGRLDEAGAYVESLIREISSFPMDASPLDTVYFGGGTPSLLEPRFIGGVLDTLSKRFGVSAGAEISMEANPATFDARRMRDFFACGVNRVSLGVQCADDAILAALGRAHNWEEAKRSAGAVTEAGFTNWNADLIFALPGQTLEGFGETLQKTLALGPSHMSLYALTPAPGTALFESGYEPDEDLDRKMYRLGCGELSKAGLDRYEISNFARPGFECLHNSLFWRGHEYLGFGAAASGFFGSVRTINPSGLDEYHRWARGEGNREERPVGEREMMEDFAMLGMRTSRGVSEESFRERFSKEFCLVFARALEESVAEGLLEHSDGAWRLTGAGVDFAGRVDYRLLNSDPAQS